MSMLLFREKRYLFQSVLILLVFLLPSLGTSAQVILPEKPEKSESPNTTIRIGNVFSGPIWRLAVTGDGSTLAVSSANETVALFPVDMLPEVPQLLALPRRSILPYRARGIAIAHDGGWIAVSMPPITRGSQDLSGDALIRVIDSIDGATIHLIESIPSRPQALALSPDGTILAAVLSEGCGLRIWRVADWSLIYTDDRDYGGCGVPGAELDTTEVRFLGNNQRSLFTAGESGVRRYDEMDGLFVRTAYRRPTPSLQRPDGLVISPDQKVIAVGDRRLHDPSQPVDLRVTLLNAQTLEPDGPPLTITSDDYFLPQPDEAGAASLRLNRLVWQGSSLSAGGVLPCKSVIDWDRFPSKQAPSNLRENCVAKWHLGSVEQDRKHPTTFLPVGDDTVIDLAGLQRNGESLLAVATRKLVAIYDANSNIWLNDKGVLFEVRSPFADLRSRIDAQGYPSIFEVSPDGQRVYLEQYDDGPSLYFDVSKLDLQVGNGDRTGMLEADTAPGTFGAVVHWFNESVPRFNPPGFLREGERLRAVAAFSNGKRAVVGTSDSIQVVDLITGAIECRLRVESEAFRINVAEEADLAIVAHGSGTLRWYAIEQTDETCSLEERLAVNLRRSQEDRSHWTWHAWIEGSGQFAADAFANPDLAWQLTQADGSVQVVNFAKLRDLYSREALRDALIAQPDPNIVKIKRDRGLKQEVDRSQEAIVKMVGPRGKLAYLDQPDVKLSLVVSGNGPWPRQLAILAKGKIAVAATVGEVQYIPGETIPLSGPGPLNVTISLPEIVMRKRGQFGICFKIDDRIQGNCNTLTWNGEELGPAPQKLWAVIVGMSDYSPGGMESLRYAQNDAIDIARMLVTDHKRPRPEGGNRKDFTDLHISLIVAPTTDLARSELNVLAAEPTVTLYPAKAGSILTAIEEIAAKDHNEELADDVLLFSYSGHGGTVPAPTGGETWLLGPDAPRTRLSDAELYTSLSITELLKALSEISAEQIALIDACRSFLRVSEQTTVDPYPTHLELRARIHPIHVGFSAAEGQYAPSSKKFVHSTHRPDEENGNGVFLYSVLAALTSNKADILETPESKGRIELIELKAYQDNFYGTSARTYFDELRKSDILTEVRRSFIAPRPVWVTAGSPQQDDSRRLFLRTLQ